AHALSLSKGSEKSLSLWRKLALIRQKGIFRCAQDDRLEVSHKDRKDHQGRLASLRRGGHIVGTSCRLLFPSPPAPPPPPPHTLAMLAGGRGLVSERFL